MSTARMRTNVKLAKLFYKYTEEPKETVKEEIAEEIEQPKEEVDYESYPPINFSWFIDKKVAAMGWPQNVANLNYLADVGVDHLVTLSPERVPPILECKKKLKWTEIRVKEFSAPTLKQIIKFIEVCERAHLRGEVIGVHCRQGRGRTGTMLACYLVHFRNMAPERAVLTVRVQRPGSCETYEQEKIVCHYHDCVRGTVEKPDYRLVEDKMYFDYSMKYMFNDDDENKNGGQDGDNNGGQDGDNNGGQDGDNNGGQDGGKIEETEKKKVTLQLGKKKSKAMVINHKIYF